MWAASLDGNTPIIPRVSRTPFFKVVTFWIPRRFLSNTGADVAGYVAELNDVIRERGYVLWDQQILTTPIDAAQAELTFEGSESYEVPEQRPWTFALRDYFGLENPYQMSEDALAFTYSHLMTRVVEPYLSSNELISGLLHGVTDDYYFYCQCHEASVVYTTRHRLVCMGCGAVHAVLESPLTVQPKRLVTAEEWDELFNQSGSRNDEEIDLNFVDFCDVEFRTMLWTTEQWAEACHRFKFFARSTPEEIEAATRNTEADPSVFLEAGFRPVDLPPVPAYQIAENSIDVDLIENAAHALRAGIVAYLATGTESDQLVHAVPQLFRVIELLLKAKLEQVSPTGLDDNPNNPTILKRLEDAGVVLAAAEAQLLKRVRQLRNKLQHGAASFNYRKGRSLCREAIIFVNRFSSTELDLWMGDAIPVSDWQRLLSIPELSATADHVAETRLQSIRADARAEVFRCDNCGMDTLVRSVPRSGALCIRCGYISS
jgi:hypothetical protein